jgi:hypothetical protein
VDCQEQCHLDHDHVADQRRRKRLRSVSSRAEFPSGENRNADDCRSSVHSDAISGGRADANADPNSDTHADAISNSNTNTNSYAAADANTNPIARAATATTSVGVHVHRQLATSDVSV